MILCFQIHFVYKINVFIVGNFHFIFWSVSLILFKLWLIFDGLLKPLSMAFKLVLLIKAIYILQISFSYFCSTCFSSLISSYKLYKAVSLWYFHTCIQCTLVKFTLNITLLTFFKIFKWISSFYFYTSILSTLIVFIPPSHSPFTLLPPTGPHPQAIPHFKLMSFLFFSDQDSAYERVHMIFAILGLAYFT
jgi:hypothetical protein